MTQKTYIVQHEWDSIRSDEVVSVVSKIIEDLRSGRLPRGFDLLGVLVSKEAPRAYCVWQCEDKSSLEHLLTSVNPPTRHTVIETNTLYGVVKP